MFYWNGKISYLLQEAKYYTRSQNGLSTMTSNQYWDLNNAQKQWCLSQMQHGIVCKENKLPLSWAHYKIYTIDNEVCSHFQDLFHLSK